MSEPQTVAQTIEATFEMTQWDQQPYDEPDDGPALTRVHLRKTYAGPLDGTGVGQVLTARGDGGASFVASERIEGTLAGRAGTFVVQHGGVMDDSGQRVFGEVVPGSGTGDLAGIAGEATEGQEGVLKLVVTFGGQPAD